MIRLDDYTGGFVDNHSHFREDSQLTDFENYYSQNGEDGILEKIFEELTITKGTFINAGADDINDHSNVRRLISFYGWDGLFIEPNRDMLEKGRKNLEKDNRIKDGEFDFHIGFLSTNSDEERINNVLSNYYPTKTLFDLLTLHIDSYEYWVLKDFLDGDYNAKVILVGYNFSRIDEVTSPENCDPKIGHVSITDNFYSASAPALKKLMDNYDYQLVSICIPNNLIFVKKSLNNGLFEPYEQLKEEDYYWEMDDWTRSKRTLVNEGWVVI